LKKFCFHRIGRFIGLRGKRVIANLYRLTRG